MPEANCPEDMVVQCSVHLMPLVSHPSCIAVVSQGQGFP
jgi:hypothetical protein